MDSKIFLGKYRISAEQVGAVGEPADDALAYEGEEIDSGKTVIVEVVPAASLKSAMRQKLEAEAEAAKELRHVNIPALYDFGVQDNYLVYVTEDFEGTLADEWVNLRGPLPVGPVLRIASQVVSALGAAAVYGISHHAINPSNLVLVPGQTAEGEWPLVKVLHFVDGTSKFPVSAADKYSQYASPEQLQHGVVDFRSEIYSLGCTMWFLLTGAPPPMVGLIIDKVGTMPKRVGRLLAQMLSANPAERPHDPLAFYRELQDCLAQMEQREKANAVPRSRPLDMPARRRSPLKTLARAAIVLAMAALSALVLREYLRHRRVVREEEPIGVPIGITEALASATPGNAGPADPIVSIVTQSVPATSEQSNDANELPTPAASLESDSTSRVAEAPVQPATAETPANPQPQETVPLTANNLSNPPPAINSNEVASNSHEKAAPLPAESPNAEAAPQATPKRTIMHEVRRAQPADPEETPAEPAPPGEGPVTQRKQRRDVEGETKAKSRNVTATESESTVLLKVPRKKKEPTPKPKQRADEAIYLPQLTR